MRAALDAGEAASAEYPELQERNQAAERELLDLIDRHHEKYKKLDAEIMRARRAIEIGEDARRNLLDGVGADTRERLTGHLNEKRIRLEKQLDDATRRQRQHEATLTNSKVHSPADDRGAESVRDAKTVAKRLSADIQHLRDELAKIQSEIAVTESKFLAADCI